MRPPGHGDSCLEADQRFTISIYGTENVFTAEGDNLRIRPYTGDPTQIWKCVKDADNHFGFINIGTGKYLGRWSGGDMMCTALHLKALEYLTFTRLSSGGYTLFVSVDESLLAVQLEPDSNGTSLKAVKDSNTIIGLHQLEEPVFRRFEWVIPGRLARSSAPHYVSHDEDQNMNSAAISFLVSHGITNVISLNSYPLSLMELGLLLTNRISYTHVCVQDYHAPTLTDFDTISRSFTSSGTTLVCCGFGHGRTGTAISALQLFTGHRLRHTDFKVNYVQTELQFDALDTLKDSLER